MNRQIVNDDRDDRQADNEDISLTDWLLSRNSKENHRKISSNVKRKRHGALYLQLKLKSKVSNR